MTIDNGIVFMVNGSPSQAFWSLLVSLDDLKPLLFQKL